MSDTSELVYLPLGGAGEIGMNCYLYGCGAAGKRRWVIVDLGIGFGDMDTAPGVDLVLPDIEFIRNEGDRLEGIVLTHAHEDHVGALPHLWAELEVPIYARAFTAEVVRRKLSDANLDPGVVQQVALGEHITVAGFDIEFKPVTHSVPEASCLVLRSPHGNILHTGDFKLDPDPQMGPAIDMDQFEALGVEGIHVLACDSTNVFLEGQAGSEVEIIPNVARLLTEATGAVAATSFASNVARLRTLAVAAHDAGRSIVVVGRAMRRMIEIAVETGQLTDFPKIISEDDAASIPAENLFYLLTGSQGESRAALARVAAGTHPSVTLKEGDTVLFSSKTIPGNESGIYRLYNRLSELGVTVIDGDMERIHVSGHARRGDLERMYAAVKPQISLPLHGEHRHLVEHAKWGKRWGATHSLIVPNGTMVRLDGNAPGTIDHVETGRIYLDGTTQVGAMDGVIRERLKLARQGHVVASVVIADDGELLADPEVRCLGAPKGGEGWSAPLNEMMADAIDDAIENTPPKGLRKNEAVEELVGRAIRRVAGNAWGKRPVVTVLVSRLED